MTTHDQRMRLNAYSSGRRPDAHTAFDLETCGAEERFRRPDFVRLGGLRSGGQSWLSTSGDEIAKRLADPHAGVLTGANICGFDLPALARWHGLDLAALDGRIYDTQLAAYVFDPPVSGHEGSSIMPRGFYGLDATAERFGVPGKTDDLKGLAKEFGGFDKIPTDHPKYREYLEGDLAASDALYTAMKSTEGSLRDYLAREMRIGLLTARMTLAGLRVDIPEIHRTLEQQAVDRAAAIEELAAITGMPTTGINPVASKAGKQAIVTWLLGQGLRDSALPRTSKGAYSLGSDGLGELLAKIKEYGGHPAIERVIHLINTVVGMRTIYQTAESCRVGDRVHPKFMPSQASGRWSVTEPGLTVFGKRKGRHVERRIILPDEGHVLRCFDLDQIDARGVAAHSGDPEYIKIFTDGLDLHDEVAKQIFGSVAFRDDAKAISHAWNYGASVKTLVANGADQEKAQRFDRRMREVFPGISRWQAKVREIAQGGGLLDNGFGRPLRCDPKFAWTQAPAQPGQGFTRDVIGHVLLRLPADVLPHVRLIVHDEFVVSAPPEDMEEISREITKAMTFDTAEATDGKLASVPISGGQSKIGHNWSQCYDK